ncbi:MAG: D-2-hydroxyacid dehydrogenase [Bryobacterales bacterium]|nr:D-2-hydroxyacid dehydrogenase [Bryobacterales bacterium]
MSQSPVSRRNFMAAAGAVPAAAAASRSPVVQAPVAMSAAAARTPKAPLLIVTQYQFEPHEIREIQAACPETPVTVTICSSREEFLAKVGDAEVVYGTINADGLRAAKKLQWVQTGAAGVESLDRALMTSPVVLTNMARAFAPGITETGMGLLLCLTRGITKYYMPQFYKREMKPVGTVKSDHHTELAGRTMGIVGMGGIGQSIARRAYYGFDMRIVGTDAKPLPRPEYVEILRDPAWFEEMVPQVDVLVSAAPHTPQTDKMFNEKVFRSMKKTAYFLALSRGKLFDDMALVRALKEGWIAGAGLDVFPQEPPPSNHPIFDCTNVSMTAHTSGWSPDRQKRLVSLFADNVRRYANGLPLANVVDKQRGY